MRTTLRPFFATLLLPLLLALLLALNLAQMLSLVAYPFSPSLFRNLNRAAASAWFGCLRWVLEVALGVRFVQTGTPFPWQENAFLLANHQAMADIPALVVLAHRSGRRGDLKWFVKDALKWVPGVGWGMLFLDCLYVKRNWTADQEKVTATFRRIRAHRSPFWVISFLEGTRANAAKIAGSQAFASRQGLPRLQHLLLPRTKGFEATVCGLEGVSQAIYDVTIAYEGKAPSLLGLFYQEKAVHLHTRRFASWPSDTAGRASWVMARYQEKDALLTHFKATGSFS